MEPGRSDHASEDHLEAYAMGRLSDREASKLEEHVAGCETCQEQLEEIQDFVIHMKAAAVRMKKEEPASPLSRIKRALPRYPTAWAAGLVALVAGSWFWAVRQAVPEGYQEVRLVASRGAGSPSSRASHTRRLEIRLDTSDLTAQPLFRAEVVDQSGRVVRSLTLPSDKGSVVLRLPTPLPTGRYWVRLYDASQRSSLIREFGLEVQ